MDQTTRNSAAAGRIGSVTSDDRLAAQVHVDMTQGASRPSQLGRNHHRNGSATCSVIAGSTEGGRATIVRSQTTFTSRSAYCLSFGDSTRFGLLGDPIHWQLVP